MKKHILFLLALAISCFSISCGYSTKASLPSHFRTIFVENFKNSIDYSAEGRRNLYLPLLEVDARNAVVDRYMIDGNLRIAKSEDADLILKGELKKYHRSGLRYSDDDDAEEYRLTVTVSLELYDTKYQKVLWTEPNFSGEATYFVSGPKATSESSAVSESLTDLARRIVERTVDDW